MPKNRLFVIIAAVIILGLALLFFLARGNRQEKEVLVTPTPTKVLEKIEADVTISVVKKRGVEEVVLTVANLPADITSVNYEMTYLTSENLPRGVLGEIRLKSGESKITRDITLGTCSRNVCKYDYNVSKVSLALKFNGTKGVRGFQQDFEL